MITKGLVMSVSSAGNRCMVRLPLFETASSSAPVEIEALVSIPPGIYNNLFVNDIVFVSFEENALEKPIIIGKLFRGSTVEATTPGGAGILDTLTVRSSANLPASTTTFVFDDSEATVYEHFTTPKKIADYIKWLETHIKNLLVQMYNDFKCFKNWTQWQLKAENVEIDDGDLDAAGYVAAVPLQYQEEGSNCEVCTKVNCTKGSCRKYSGLNTKNYPNT